MAQKYFSYKTADDLNAAAKSLGVGEFVQADSDYSATLQPAMVGKRKVGNRFGVHPMEGCDGTPDGKPDKLTVRRWQRFGGGGFKVIWGEAIAISDDSRANARQLWIHEGSWESIARMVDECRKSHREVWGANACDDLLVGAQITHSGRYSYRKPLIVQRDPALDAATLVPGPNGKIPMPADYATLTDDDLKRIEDQYIAAVKLAVKCGFDFVDIKQCHRYLLNELLGSYTRPGPYGGSFENRTRCIKNVLGRIKAEVSKDLLLGTRLGVFDCVPYMKGPDGKGCPRPHTLPYQWSWGVNKNNPLEPDLTEVKAHVKQMQEWGLNILNVSMGNPYSNPHIGRPFEIGPLDGYDSPEHPLLGVARHFKLAGELQSAFPDLPMMGTGYSWLQHLFMECGASNVKRGKITFVGLGRGSFAYPDFLKDLRDKGKLDLAKVCIAVSSCTALMRSKGNELGQFPSGCVPRDAAYKKIYQSAVKSFKAGNKPGTTNSLELEKAD
jgi:2,4-dienoyl-CoA reductase-like NADH-dependent reductase (Old Yellow Enzyme family)